VLNRHSRSLRGGSN